MADLTLDSTLDAIAEAARDAFYVSVGAGVIAFQKLQVQRVELTKTLSTQLDDARGNAKDSYDSVTDLVEDRVKLVEERLAAVEDRLDAVLAQIEEKLPEQARDLVKQARELVGRAA
ncbi:MAG: hypothetical protein ABI239_06080 [Aquihabitans sp.]